LTHFDPATILKLRNNVPEQTVNTFKPIHQQMTQKLNSQSTLEALYNRGKVPQSATPVFDTSSYTNRIATLYGRNNVTSPMKSTQEFYKLPSHFANVAPIQDDFRPVSSFANIVISNQTPRSIPMNSQVTRNQAMT
jgi:hypothetical protein